MLLSWLVKQWSWKSFAVGLGTVVVGSAVARPVLVTAVRSGMDIADLGSREFEKAKAEAISIKNEAEAQRSATTSSSSLNDVLAGIQEELKNLRKDVADAKGAPAKKAPA